MFERDSITLHLKGGVGNQLFQATAGLFFAQKLGKELQIREDLAGQTSNLFAWSLLDQEKFKVDSRLPRTKKEILTGDWREGRGGGLDLLNLFLYPTPPEVVHESKWRERKLESVRGALGETIFDPRDGNYNEIIFRDFNYARRIKGYFQTRIFWSNLNELLDVSNANVQIFNCQNFELSVRNKLSEMELSLLKSLTNESSQYVGLHVRRGDFCSNAKTYGLLGKKYYISMLKKMIIEFPNLRVLIFSDSTTESFLIGQEIFKEFGLKVIDLSYLDDEKTFFFMMQLQFFILSNSSFSYWAITLGRAKRVIAPFPWFRSFKFSESIYDPLWTLGDSIWTENIENSRF